MVQDINRCVMLYKTKEHSFRHSESKNMFSMICDWKDMVTEEHGIMVTDLMVLLFLYTHCSFDFLFVPLCHYKMVIFSK